MPYEFNLKNILQDFNPSKFIVHCSVFTFSLLFSLKLDSIIEWSYWIVFLPLWIWKCCVFFGCSSGCWVWIRHPVYRSERDAATHFRAMVIATSLQLLLLLFELMACDKLENQRAHIIWLFVFIPLLSISVISIGLCIWALKHGRTFEFELFCSVNILQFIFFALRLDNFINWRWVIIFIPIWIVLCVALVCVFYAIVLSIILLKSSDIVADQKRGNAFSAIGSMCIVTPLLVFNILLTNKLDGVQDIPYSLVVLPLLLSFFTMILMSFNARGSNQWWFGLRKDFCTCLLDKCLLLQEYGNISYSRASIQQQQSTEVNNSSTENNPVESKSTCKKKQPIVFGDDNIKVPIVYLDVPD